MNQPTDDDMRAFYDSQELKGRTVKREGELKIESVRTKNRVQLDIAIEELKGTMIWLRDLLSGVV